jgi:secretion/DNA translocation related CpaE-like protein
VHPPALVDALPGEGSLAVLSFDRTALTEVPPQAMAAALDAGRRGRDVVVVDIPRRFDDASLLALTSAERCYVVVLAELRACAAAQRIVAEVGRHCPAMALVVRLTDPGGVRPQEIAEALDLPLAGVLVPEPRLVRSMAAGHPPARTGRGPLAELCALLLADLAPRHRAGRTVVAR